MTHPNANAHTPDEMVYIRTTKGQERLLQSESRCGLEADQRRALLLVNGFTPVCALFGAQTLKTPVDEVLDVLLKEGLIAAIERARPQPQPQAQRKWFGPAIVAMAASMRHTERTALQESKPAPDPAADPA